MARIRGARLVVLAIILANYRRVLSAIVGTRGQKVSSFAEPAAFWMLPVLEAKALRRILDVRQARHEDSWFPRGFTAMLGVND